MEKNELTTIQKEILYAIEKFTLKNGYSPSTRELCYLVNLSSTSSIHNQLNNLEKLGYIKRNNHKSRTIEILNKEEKYIKIPYLNNKIDILKNIDNKKYLIDFDKKLNMDNTYLFVKDFDKNITYILKKLDKYEITDKILIQDNQKLIIKNYDNDKAIGKIMQIIQKYEKE